MSDAPPPPLPAAGQVWIKIDDPRDQDSVLAVKSTTIPGVELITWGRRPHAHMRVDAEAARAADEARLFGIGRTELWPPIGRYLHSGLGAPWSPTPIPNAMEEGP